MQRLPIALELYSIRDELFLDLLGSLKKVKAMGYDGVEFFGGHGFPAEEVVEALAETGLSICGWHTGWDMLSKEKIDDTIAYNKAVGNKYIIIPGIGGLNTAADWHNFAKEVNRIAIKLKEHGMATGYHNHAFEFQPVDGELPWEIFFKSTSQEVIMQIDTGNAASGNADFREWVKKFPGRSKTVHLKPYSMKDGFDTMIGTDDTNWGEAYRICRDLGGAEWLVVEYESDKLPQLEGAQKCIEALRSLEAQGAFY